MNLANSLRDARYFQIAALSSLLVYGIAILDFGISWRNAIAIFATAQLVQWGATHKAGLTRFDPLSALITSLSLTLLLRTESIVLAAMAAAIAIGSKFLIRVRGKHVFNPANLALVTVMLATDRAWVSSGQWGSATIGALALSCLGFLVLTRARRAETTMAFLATFATLLFGRSLWLGDPLTIPVHQLQNGALLIFAFFMVSDPKTTPDAAVGRALYGVFVAVMGFIVQFIYYVPNGPILALVLTAPFVPAFDILLRGARYRWRQSQGVT